MLLGGPVKGNSPSPDGKSAEIRGCHAPVEAIFFLFQLLEMNRGKGAKEDVPKRAWTRHPVLIVLDKTFRI
jgi:hypothetical protein